MVPRHSTKPGRTPGGSGAASRTEGASDPNRTGNTRAPTGMSDSAARRSTASPTSCPDTNTVSACSSAVRNAAPNIA